MAKLEFEIDLEALGKELAEHGFVEVVRCKECKWFQPTIEKRGYCNISQLVEENDWFCADGERRE